MAFLLRRQYRACHNLLATLLHSIETGGGHVRFLFYSADDEQIVGSHPAEAFDPTRVIAALASRIKSKI